MEDMEADVLTKALAKERHQRLATTMGLREGNYSQVGALGFSIACSYYGVVNRFVLR